MSGWLVVLIRSSVVFLATLILVRLMGKRHAVRLTPFNYVTYLAIAAIAVLMAAGIVSNLIYGSLVLAVWVVFPVILDFLSIKSKFIHDLVNGKETVLIKRGKIMEENLLQTRLTGEELLGALRRKNVFHIADVEFAVLEPTGDISVLLKSDKKPLTPHDLAQQVAPKSEPQTVILDGNLLHEPLSTLGLNQEWLFTELNKAGVSLENVFIGQVDASGDLYLDLFDDSLQVPQPKVKELAYVNLEKCYADILSFAAQTKNEMARKMYFKNAQKIERLLNQLESYLLR